MPDVNTLRQWLDIYDREMPRGGMGGGSMWETQGARNQIAASDAHNNASRRMAWAERMMGGQMGAQETPDFFGDEDMGAPDIQYRRPQAPSGPPPMPPLRGRLNGDLVGRQPEPPQNFFRNLIDMFTKERPQRGFTGGGIRG